jgi:hypothetical protein
MGGHYLDDSQGDGSGFAQELAVGIKENGTISSVNLLMNYIGIDQAEALVSILKEHPTLKSLCGNRGNETELLDMRGKLNGAGDAVMLAAEIINSVDWALTSLDISSNHLVGEKGTGRYKTVAALYSDESDEEEEIKEPEYSGIIALADAIPDMRAMTSLNLASNSLGVGGAKIIAACLPKCT